MESESDAATTSEPIPAAEPVPGRRRRRLLVSITVVALGALGVLWSVATPIGSAPDDSFHLASIWCGPLAPDSACSELGSAFAAGKRVVEVPAEIGPQAHCYAFDPQRSAGCQAEIDNGSRATVLANDGVYPPVFYTLLGVAVGSEPVNSALLARMLSWGLSIGLLALGWSVLPRGHRTGYTLVLLIVAVPLGAFLWASTNPSGVVVAGVVAAWCAVIAILCHERRGHVLAGASLLVAALLLASGSRADGGIYAFVAVAAASVLVWRSAHDRVRRVASVAVAATAGLAVSLWTTTQRFETGSGLGSSLETAQSFRGSTAELLWYNFRELPYFLVGNLGQGPSGWLDLGLPSLVSVPILAGYFGLAFWGIGWMNLEKGVALLLLAGALAFIPFVTLWRGSHLAGSEFQPRYVLPLVPVLGFTALYRTGWTLKGLTRVRMMMLLIGVTIAHSVSLHTHIRRHVTGVDVLAVNLDRNRGWWWDLPVITPNVVWLAGSAAFSLIALCVGLTFTAADREDDSENEATSDAENPYLAAMPDDGAAR